VAQLLSLEALGDMVTMARTNPKHLAGVGEAPVGPRNAESGFGELLLKALNQVNDSQVTAVGLAQKMITDPDSVDVHDVSIALAEANMTLSMTKAVVDRVLAAYREIINVR
jgi:flagellar hook-basal body complex protein FliE